MPISKILQCTTDLMILYLGICSHFTLAPPPPNPFLRNVDFSHFSFCNVSSTLDELKYSIVYNFLCHHLRKYGCSYESEQGLTGTQ